MDRKLLAAVGLAAVVLALFAAPAGAAPDGSSRDDRRISITGGEVVAAGEVVNGPVVSVDGRTVINGTVNGHVKTLNIGNLFGGFLIAFLIVLWIAVTVSVALLGLLFVLLLPRAADATTSAGRRFWPTLAWGALISIAGPILGVLVLV